MLTTAVRMCRSGQALWECCESASLPIDLVNCVIGSRQTHHCESVCAQEPGDIRCHMAMSKFQVGSYHIECKPSPPLWECALWECALWECALWECLPEPLLGNCYTTEQVPDVFHRPGDFKPACKVLTSVRAFAFWVCGLEICCDSLLHCESARNMLWQIIALWEC